MYVSAMCLLRTLVICLCLSFVCSYGGIYVDNGRDQTEFENEITKHEERAVQLQLLKMLDLPKKPTVKRYAAAPKFLMDVYRSLAEERDFFTEGGGTKRIRRDVDFDLSVEEAAAIEESDVIMTFDNVNDRVSTVRHERGKRLLFNVTVPGGQEFIGAELRVFKKTIFLKRKFLTITIHEVHESYMRLITLINTTSTYTGWLEFNLTSNFPLWYGQQTCLYLSVLSDTREFRPEEIGLTMEKLNPDTKPFLVAFFKATNRINGTYARHTRTTPSFSFLREIQDVTLDSCRMHALYISFKDLKWNDWIIAPEGYHAHFCKGECNFPLQGNMNASNHAIVQSLMHLVRPSIYSKPCCVPIKLSTISVLYHIDDTNVTLKKYKGMTVKSCGCL